MKITRIWHGRVPLEMADDYERFSIKKAAADYGSVAGLKKLYFQRKDETYTAHFFFITIWDSIESVKKFAGDNPEIAKYYTEDDHFLLEKEKHVTLYNVFYEK